MYRQIGVRGSLKGSNSCKTFSPGGVFDFACIFSPGEDFSCDRRRAVKNYSITFKLSIKSCFCVGTNDKLDLGTISYIANCDFHTST